jgi:hypothetical protein
MEVHYLKIPSILCWNCCFVVAVSVGKYQENEVVAVAVAVVALNLCWLHGEAKSSVPPKVPGQDLESKHELGPIDIVPSASWALSMA